VGRLVETQAKQTRVAKLAVPCPLHECDLDHDFGPHPVHVQPRRSQRFREGRRRHLECVQPPAQFEQELGVEAGADFAREYELSCIEVAYEQGA
jgi:hypothetical protein